MRRYYGAIEAGGTKFNCAVGNESGELVAEKRISTTTPEETIGKTIYFFAPYAQAAELAGVGIGSFGPVDLDPDSPHFGYITTTPKPGWSQVDLLGQVKQALGVPAAFDTDVNVAAMGEQYWTPENRSLDPFVYVTVGTGIGVGIIANGSPIHGLVHPEAGHFPLPHDLQKDPFPGSCPYHGDCWEGLANGPAMAKRWGQPAETLSEDHPGWELEAEYNALALANIIYAYSPKRIVLGGGVMQHPRLHEMVRRKVQEILNGYVQSPTLLDKIEDYIIQPTLGNRSGVMGALALAIGGV